mmetsp:Transcript_36963/g.54070  ORF Transcript_36963/g.54070 Transcript_36963/m.54070 type:complete len:291 (+) Transcript_36963:58-930(+)
MMMARSSGVNRILRVRSSTVRRSSSSAAPLVSEDESKLKLYQYAICPFCHKAKALLSYASVPHEIVEVNPLNKAELKTLADQSVKKVPIAVLEQKDGRSVQINGSNDIIEALLEDPKVMNTLQNKWAGTEMTMEAFQQGENVERWWYRYADDDLAALLYPNVCRTLSDSRKAFAYVKDVEHFSAMQKFLVANIGSLAMYFAASKIKSKRNIKDEQKALQTTLDLFENEALAQGQHLFASQNSVPDMGDIAVYGVLSSVKGLPVHDYVLQQSRESDVLMDWYARMEEEVHS